MEADGQALTRTVTTLRLHPAIVARCTRIESLSGSPKQQRQTQSAAADALVRQLLGGATLQRHADGYILWPGGWVGSVAHALDRVVVTIAPADALTALGVDIEHPERVTPQLWANVFTSAECAELSATRGDRQSLHATIYFAAKEAAYKALYPRHGAVAGFHDSKVTVSEDQSLTVSVNASCYAGALHGRWVAVDGYVVVSCWA